MGRMGHGAAVVPHNLSWKHMTKRRITLMGIKIWSLICLIVSFINYMISSSREFYLQGSITNMNLHLSYYYYGEYLCFQPHDC